MNKTIEFSKNELKKYTNKYGIDVSKISLKCDSDKFGLYDCERDAYYINIKNFCGEIIGNNERSILLGVYRFLSEIGFVFSRPGQNGTVYPKNIKSDVSIYKISDVKYRGISFSTEIKFDALLDIIDFLPKLGYNTFFFEFQDSGYYFEKEYGADFTKEHADRLRDMAKSELKRRDMIIQTCGHGWTSKIVSELLNIENVSGFEKSDCDRENGLIAMIGGKRKIFNSMPAHTHLCYSNPDVIKKLTEEVLDYCKRHTDEKYIHVWLADYFNNFCECENCVTDVPQKFYQILLREIDRKLSENGINTKIIFLIYFDLLFKPKNLYVNSERFILLYCPYSRDTSQSFSELKFDEKTPCHPFSYNHNEPWIKNDELYSHLKEWGKDFKGEKILFDYPYFDMVFNDFAGMQIAINSFNDAKVITKMGLDGYISCHNMKTFFPHAFGLYVLGKTLFDNTADYEIEKDRYFSAVKGLKLFETAERCIPLSYIRKQSKQIDAVIAENVTTLKVLAKKVENDENEDCYLKIWAELLISFADIVYEKASGNESDVLNAWTRFDKKLKGYEPIIGEIYDIKFVDELTHNFAKESW